MALRYQEVKFEIKKLILSSKEGSRIPSRNFLSRKYQVARNTIDKAITELEQEGYLNSVKGSGTYVTGRFSRNVNIGVILPSLMGDVYPQFISGIEDYATANHINVVLLSSESIPEKQKRNVYQMIEMGADGCIIIPIINSEMSFETLDLLKKKKIPFVLCNRSIDGLNAPFVGTNNHYGAYMATKHLIEGAAAAFLSFTEKIFYLHQPLQRLQDSTAGLSGRSGGGAGSSGKLRGRRTERKVAGDFFWGKDSGWGSLL